LCIIHCLASFEIIYKFTSNNSLISSEEGLGASMQITFAEMNKDEKGEISHRGKAIN